MRIEAGRARGLGVLQEIERAAGRWFGDIGMDEIADDEPPTLESLESYAHSGGLWVVTPEHGSEPVAYALTEPVDGCLHVEQISVHPDSARRGVGRALLDELSARAAADGVPALTLTTFAEVPWNAPYYARLGFRSLAAGELTPGLRQIRADEAAAGLDRWPRVCMRRETSSPAHPAPAGSPYSPRGTSAAAGRTTTKPPSGAHPR
ncbi:GNAT family N-acetyltransferase [Streptomyces reniochalinae]|uniref:GNAT family N-acetyltransferase n=1 Tax=Streptomyces reniochalinae TaxID=2250578 RepID=A0A367F611_9ACTN|nr:GNAT family N-acetyltransferase [Streptomyces reniochalinae]RCG25773.1 GNAT family N-acetyltransferase [Streptomyces reniochalinae]